MSHLREGGARDKTNTFQKGGAWGGTVTVAVEMLGKSNAENTTTK